MPSLYNVCTVQKGRKRTLYFEYLMKFLCMHLVGPCIVGNSVKGLLEHSPKWQPNCFFFAAPCAPHATYSQGICRIRNMKLHCTIERRFFLMFLRFLGGGSKGWLMRERGVCAAWGEGKWILVGVTGVAVGRKRLSAAAPILQGPSIFGAAGFDS